MNNLPLGGFNYENCLRNKAIEANLPADKNCEKIHKLAPNIFCCGAGTAADCEHVTGKCAKKANEIANMR